MNDITTKTDLIESRIDRVKPIPSLQRVRELVDYNPETGATVWKVRPLRPGNEHHDKIWNARFPGTPVGFDNVGYLATSIDGERYLVHRLCWFLYYGSWPSKDIDHINGNKRDNRIVNLRLATDSQNLCNGKLRKDSTSGFKGVSLDSRDGRWQAYLNVNGRRLSLGRYDTPEDAHAVRDAAAKQHHGEFARVR